MSFGVSPMTMNCSGCEIHLQMFANTFCRARRKIATIVRLVAERAREGEELFEPDQLHLQLRHRLDVARHER